MFSIHSSLGFAVLVLGMALAFVLMLLGDVLLLAIVLFFGLIDLGAEWKRRQDGPAVMTGYGAFLSAAWFVATLGVLIAVMWAVSGNPEADLALELLRD